MSEWQPCASIYCHHHTPSTKPHPPWHPHKPKSAWNTHIHRPDLKYLQNKNCEPQKIFQPQKIWKRNHIKSKIWELKDAGHDYEIKWKMVERSQPFSPITGVCALCTLEKYYILFNPELASLNKRNEINNHCFHKVPQLLDNTWSPGTWINPSVLVIITMLSLVVVQLSDDSECLFTHDETLCNNK